MIERRCGGGEEPARQSVQDHSLTPRRWWLAVCVCTHVCVWSLRKPTIHQVVHEMPYLPPLLSALRQCALLAALRRTSSHMHGGGRPLFLRFYPKWDKSGISQLPRFLVSDEAGNKFPKKTYPGIRYALRSVSNHSNLAPGASIVKHEQMSSKFRCCQPRASLQHSQSAVQMLVAVRGESTLRPLRSPLRRFCCVARW